MKEIRTVTLKGDDLTRDGLARALAFPAYCGKSADALYDCLTELPPTVLFLKSPLPADCPLLRVLYDAAAASRCLWIYVQ